jgi:two-component system sensor histidine kinase KdpD
MDYNKLMMDGEPKRPDPDQLLAHIQSEEQDDSRGRLKIFLGYAAGVGKTYAMLEAAHQRTKEGVEVVIGYVETHGRTETEAFLEGLELIPRRIVKYRGVELTELDVDAVLERHPQLALIDELAHTNVAGSRHPKRYQDIEELLAAGIDVYTTLNIQHLESLNDVVAQITGVQVHETVPDRVIDLAAEIELIDLPPDELLIRLQEGKVYIPEQAARAIQKFFRKGNLTALRELSLRRTAERVDEQMTAYMQTRAIPGPWPATERLLVCIGPNSLGERLVRSTRRLADELKAEWQVVYVETPDHARLPQKRRDQVIRTIQLAEELGARSQILLPGSEHPSVAGTVLEYARKHNITKIIAGKPLRPFWQEFLRGSIVDQLIRQSGNIDVFVVSSAPEGGNLPPEEIAWRPHRPWSRYLYSLLMVTVATALGLLVRSSLSPVNVVMIYLLVVVISALYLGRGPAVFASILSVLAFDFFLVPPHYTLAVSDTEYLLTFAALMVVGLVISYLTVREREQADSAKKREAETAALYSLSRDLATSQTLEEVLKAVITHTEEVFDRDTIIFLPEESGHLTPYGGNQNYSLDENEMAVAVWAYQHSQSAGRSTNNLPAARVRYIPLKNADQTIGVLGVNPKEIGPHLTPDQLRLMEAFASQSAQAIERVRLAEQARQGELLQVTEKLQSALLNSISHDLRTPLVSITGALTSLRDGGNGVTDETRKILVETACEEADRLNRLVGNLLSMTRLEGGAIQLLTIPSEMEDLIGAALEQIKDRLGDRPVLIRVSEDFPLVPVDFALLVQVLVNVIENAMKYSPADAPIEIEVRQSNGTARITIADQGIGIPAEDLDRVFDKFYRVRNPDNISGTGLGLSICRGIVEAHQGRITAGNRPGGGTIITIDLPLQSSSI